MDLIFRRRLPMVFASSVEPLLARAIEKTLDRLPFGVAAALRGRPAPALGYAPPGWLIEMVRAIPRDAVRGKIFGWCQPTRHRVLFARVALRLPEEALCVLVAHEFAHGWLYDSDPDAWKEETAVDYQLYRWGFDSDLLMDAAQAISEPQAIAG